jgi:hypothetical protein
MRQAGQRDNRQAEQFDPGAFIFDALFDRIVNDFDGLDLPAGIFGAAIRALDCTRCIGSTFKRHLAINARRFVGGKAAAVVEDKQHIFDNAVAQRFGDLDRIAIGDIALWPDRADIAQKR